MVSVASRYAFKLQQIYSFIRETKTPLNLVLDSLKLKRRTFVAINSDGIKLQLEPRRGESFTFFESFVRRDHLADGITRIQVTPASMSAQISDRLLSLLHRLLAKTAAFSRSSRHRRHSADRKKMYRLTIYRM
jgi:hypothetical protein